MSNSVRRTLNVGEHSPTNNRILQTLGRPSSSASLDAIRDLYANDSAPIKHNTTSSKNDKNLDATQFNNNGGNNSNIRDSTTGGSNNITNTSNSNSNVDTAKEKLRAFANQEAVERLKKSIRIFVSQEVHGHFQQYKDKINFLKETFRHQTMLYEEKISILEAENSSLLEANKALETKARMCQQTLQEQTDTYSKERQWLLEQLAAYAYTLTYVQNHMQANSSNVSSINNSSAPFITVDSPIGTGDTSTSTRARSYALSTSTSTSDLPGTYGIHPNYEASSPASHSVGIPVPLKMPPPPPKLPPKDLFILKPLKINKTTSPNTSNPSTPKSGVGYSPDLISQIRKVKVDSGTRTAAFAQFEESRKKTKEESKSVIVAQLSNTRSQLKNTGNMSKLEENRKKQEELLRQKAFNGARPASHHAATCTDNNNNNNSQPTKKTFASKSQQLDSDEEGDLESPIDMMVNSFIKKQKGSSDDEDDEDDDENGGLGDMLRSLLVGARGETTHTHKAPP